MPSRVLWCVLLALVACSSTETSTRSSKVTVPRQEYAPCNGEPGACSAAIRFGGASGEGCLCKHYCKIDADCPSPSTGTATPYCVPYGDVVENGHTGDCRLRCEAGAICPDRMFCFMGGCLGTISK